MWFLSHLIAKEVMLTTKDRVIIRLELIRQNHIYTIIIPVDRQSLALILIP